MEHLIKPTLRGGALVLALGVATGCSWRRAPEQADVPLAPTPELYTAKGWQKFFRPPQPAEGSSGQQEPTPPTASKKPVAVRAEAHRLISARRWDEAEAALKAAIITFPADRELLLDLATLHLEQGQATRGFEVMAEIREQIGRIAPPVGYLFRYRYVLARLHLAEGRTGESVRILYDLIASDPSFSPGYATLASIYLEQGATDIAAFVLGRGIERGVPSAALFNLRGVIAAARGDSEAKAIGWYDKALGQQPGYVPALINKGIAHLKGEDTDLARATLQKALKADPGNARAHLILGLTEIKAFHYEQAEALLRRAIALDPTSGVARFNLALLDATHTGNHQRARRLFDEVAGNENHDPALRRQARLISRDLSKKLTPEG